LALSAAELLAPSRGLVSVAFECDMLKNHRIRKNKQTPEKMKAKEEEDEEEDEAITNPPYPLSCIFHNGYLQ